MPDILIRGMDMPENCGECFLSSLGRCKVAGKEIVLWQTNRKDDRPLFCHLYELPPHGDLISRDEAVSVLQSIGSRNYRREKGTICDAIKMISHSQYVPAIIPASEEDG